MNVWFYSSFLFLTNVGSSIYFKQYVYATLFMCLFGISILVHYYETNLYIDMIDKLFIFLVITHSGYTFIKNKYTPIQSILILICFLSTLYIYFYLDNSSINYNEWIHLVLHIFSSVGHHLILLL
jgi:hypothetical protein